MCSYQKHRVNDVTLLCMKNTKQTKTHLVLCMHLLVFLSETQNDMQPCDYYMCMKNAKQQ